MDGIGREPAGLADELASLKRRGCTVLVAGDPGGGTALCPELLGRSTLDRRHVLVATTTSVADLLARRGLDDRDPSRLGVVDAATAARRDAVATAGPAAAVDPSAEWYSRVDDLTDLPGLARAVAVHVRRVAPENPESGQVRLCLDSLDPFLDGVDRATTFRFLHLLAGVVRGTRGLGHVHVAAGSLADLADVEVLFDATVRVRSDADGTASQHWTVHESGQESGWLPVGDGGPV